MSEKLIDHARFEYARVLQVPLASMERHMNSAYMCFLRSFIAEYERRSEEDVQLEYEWRWQWQPQS